MGRARLRLSHAFYLDPPTRVPAFVLLEHNAVAFLTALVKHRGGSVLHRMLWEGWRSE